MIKKYLVCGKHVYMQSKKPEAHEDQGSIIELLMDIEDYWRIKDLLKFSDYLISSGETQAEVKTNYQKVFKICSRWAIQEKDRNWLYAKSQEGN